MGADIEEVNWDQLRLRPSDSEWPYEETVDLADPLGFTRAEVEPIIDGAREFRDVLTGLQALNTETGRGQSGPVWSGDVVGTSEEVN